MSNIFLITQSEFLRRIKTKGFLLGILLAPLGLLVILGLPILLAVFQPDDDVVRRVAVLDESGQLFDAVADAMPERFQAEAVSLPLDSLRAQVLDERLDLALVLPASLLEGTGDAAAYARSGGGLSQFDDIRDAVREAVREVRLSAVGATPEVTAVFETRPGVRSITVTEQGDAADGTFVASAIGYAAGLIIYMLVFIYGSLVMRGVIEEKQNRIVEVIASSVSPFELLMGKVLGIGAVGLTQIVAWVALGFAVLTAVGPLLLAFGGGPPDPAAATDAAAAADLPFDIGVIGALLTPGYLTVLVLCFLGGYLFYAALFAAVGSAVEQESDAQTLSLPVTLPAVLPMLFLFPILDRPDATLSVVLSILPPFSTVLLPVRMAVVDVPFWQIALALGLLAGAFLGAIWLAARVYRVGILSYGKKPSFRELWRWARTA